MYTDTTTRPEAQLAFARRACALLLALILACLATPPPALAIPEGGASPDTPGTYAEVSPKELRPGATIQFAVSGYPAGEVVNIKIDDGLGYSDQSTAGTGVVHTQLIGASGSTSGSLRLPSDLPEGWHWLRFLASETVAGKGVLGYTNGAGSASNSGHPTAFYIAGESLGGATAEESVVESTSPGAVNATQGGGSSNTGNTTGEGALTEEEAAAAADAAVMNAGNSAATDTFVDANQKATKGTYVLGTGEPLIYRAARSLADGFTGLSVDGSSAQFGSLKQLADGSWANEIATVREGSTIVTVQPAFLETLSVGTHTLTLHFLDGKDITVSFTIAAANAAANTAVAGAPGAFDDLPLPGLIALGVVVVGGIAALMFVALKRPRPAIVSPVDDPDQVGDGRSFGGGFTGPGSADVDAAIATVVADPAVVAEAASVAAVVAEAAPAPTAAPVEEAAPTLSTDSVEEAAPTSAAAEETAAAPSPSPETVNEDTPEVEKAEAPDTDTESDANAEADAPAKADAPVEADSTEPASA
jgi:hypothetical protein